MSGSKKQGTAKAFDRQLGEELLARLPCSPGIYRFYNDANELIYVGKAKNLRRRLSQYRNAKRRKAHAKMRSIVAEARRLEHEVCATEFEALSLENSWIQKNRPKWNIEGAFYFLYPMVGIHRDQENLYLVYTTQPGLYPAFSFHGAFRSRERTREGYFSLIELLRFIGHPISASQLKKSNLAPGPIKHSYLHGFRQISPEWQCLLPSFFQGNEFAAIEELSLLLLERPTALARSQEIQEHLRTIRRFWRNEASPLKKACDTTKWPHYPVPQKERDLLFITHRTKVNPK